MKIPDKAFAAVIRNELELLFNGSGKAWDEHDPRVEEKRQRYDGWAAKKLAECESWSEDRVKQRLVAAFKSFKAPAGDREWDLLKEVPALRTFLSDALRVDLPERPVLTPACQKNIYQKVHGGLTGFHHLEEFTRFVLAEAAVGCLGPIDPALLSPTMQERYKEVFEKSLAVSSTEEIQSAGARISAMDKPTPEQTAAQAELESFCRPEAVSEGASPPAGRTLTVKISRKSEPVVVKTFDTKVIKIGRFAEAHLRLVDAQVSRIHAVVEITADGEIVIVDVGSSSGTYVNGKKVNKATIKPGDEVRIGESSLMFELRQKGPTSAMDAILQLEKESDEPKGPGAR